MMQIITLVLLVGVGADVVDHSIKFTGVEFVKDTMPNGEYVHNIIEHEPHAHRSRRPSREWYPKFYEDFPIRFVTGLPQLMGHGIDWKHTKIDLYTLSAPMTRSTAKTLHYSEVQRRNSKQTGFGMILKDDDGREMGRIAGSFWAVSHADHNVPKLNENQDEVTFLNRAATSYTISKGSWEDGYWETARQLNAHPLRFQEGYSKFEKLVQMYAQKYPHYVSHELRHAKSDKVIQPAISCPTFLEHMVKGFTGRDALQENLAPVATPVMKVPDGQHLPIGQKKGAKIARGEHEEIGYPKFTLLHPRFYDEFHSSQSKHETPSEMHAFTPAAYYWRHNYNAGDMLPKTFNGFLAAMQNNTAQAIEQQKEENRMFLAKQFLLGITGANAHKKDM